MHGPSDMQLGAQHTARGVDPIDHHGLRRLVRIAGTSSCRHVPLRSLVVIVERHGHPRMASWATSEVSRLNVGIAESRAFQALMRGETEPRDPRVLVVPFPRDRAPLAGLVRFESADPIGAQARVALGIEAFRLAVTIETADALSLGDYALRPDQPASALIAEDGVVISANKLFDALAQSSLSGAAARGADLIDDLGTAMRDRDALRRVVDESAVSGGAPRDVSLRIGPAARSVTVRCAAPVAGLALVTLVDASLAARVPPVEPARTLTRLPTATLDRTTLAAVDGNVHGLQLFSGLLARIAAEDRLSFLASTVDVERDPTWLGPFALADGGTIEIAAIASEHHGAPAIVALAGR